MTPPPASFFVNVDQVAWIERRPGVFWKKKWEKGCVHTVTSPRGALVFMVTSGPTEPV